MWESTSAWGRRAQSKEKISRVSFAVDGCVEHLLKSRQLLTHRLAKKLRKDGADLKSSMKCRGGRLIDQRLLDKYWPDTEAEKILCSRCGHACEVVLHLNKPCYCRLGKNCILE